MKKLLIILSVFILSSGISGNAQSVKSILKKHYAAIGQSRINQAEGAVMKGVINQMGMELPFAMYYKKTGKVRFEASFQEMKIIQAYDGKIGWMINPMSGPSPSDMGVSETKAVKDMGEFEGRLYNWKKKNYKVTYEGDEDYNGVKVHKIKLVTSDEVTEVYYINSNSFLVEKIDSKAKMQGLNVESTKTVSDYRTIDGSLMPFKMEISMDGQSNVVMDITSFEFKKASEIEDSLFTKPVTQ